MLANYPCIMLLKCYSIHLPFHRHSNEIARDRGTGQPDQPNQATPAKSAPRDSQGLDRLRFACAFLSGLLRLIRTADLHSLLLLLWSLLIQPCLSLCGGNRSLPRDSCIVDPVFGWSLRSERSTLTAAEYSYRPGDAHIG